MRTKEDSPIIVDNLSLQGQVFMTTNFLEVVQLNVRKLAVSSNIMFDLDVFKSLRKKILPQRQKSNTKTFSLFAIVLPFNFLHKTTDMLIWRYSFLILSRWTKLGFLPLRIATMCLSCDHWSFKDECMKKSAITWHQISWAFYFLIGQVYFMRQSTMKLPEKQIRQSSR